MSSELTTAQERKPSVAEFKADRAVLFQVMKTELKENVDYGVVPGTTGKPTLFKPGAEKIAAIFHIAVSPEIEDVSTSDSIRYRIRAVCTHMGTGRFIGAGVGECSSDEEKYKWRKAVCDAEYTDTPEDRRRKKYFRNGDIAMQVRTNPSDQANTILKMAKKRSLIDAILTCTGASDIFDQDLEEYPHAPTEEGPQPVRQPQRKAQAAPRPAPAESGGSIASTGGDTISDKQASRLYAILKGTAKTWEELAEHMNGTYEYLDIEHFNDLTQIEKAHYRQIEQWINS